jgi:hypothetical protein
MAATEIPRGKNMNPKLILCFALVLSGGLSGCFGAALAQGTNTNGQIQLSGADIRDIKAAVQAQTFHPVVNIAPVSSDEALVSVGPCDLDKFARVFRVKKQGAGWMAAAQEGTEVMCRDYLYNIGPKLGCHFTLEYRGYRLTGKSSELVGMVSNDLSIASIPALFTKLHHDLSGFSLEPDAKNPKIIHIIESGLNSQKDYVLNRRIDLRYSGNLVGCTVKDAEGRELVKGEGLVVAASKEAPGIQDGSDEAGSEGAFNDCYTTVTVNATNETVRGILTDYIPLADYPIVLWQAVTTITGQEGKTNVLVQFYGPKRVLTNAPVNQSDTASGLPPDVTNVSNQIDPATGLHWGNLILDPTTGLPMSQTQDEGAKAYFKYYLAQCSTNEIICLWFLQDNPKVGMVMGIDLKEESVTTVRDVFKWAFQNFETRKLSHSQILNLKKIISSLPASDKNADFNKSVFVSLRNGSKVEVFQYDRQHAPGIVRRMYDIGGGYLN